MTHATHPPAVPIKATQPKTRVAQRGGGRANCWSCLSISCGYQVIPSVQKPPQPVGVRHQRHWPSFSPLFSGFPSFQKSLADPLLPFPTSAIQLSKARFSQERICPRHQCSPLSSFPTSSVVQRQLDVSRPSSISHSVAEPSLTQPIHRANNIIVPRHYPPVETLASAAAAGTIGLLETPQSPTSLQTISQSPSTSARDNP
jgi:hypothetical protein